MNYLTGWYLLGVRNVVCTCSQWRSSSEYMHRCEKHRSLRVRPETIFVSFYPVPRMKSRINKAGLRSLRRYVTTRGSIRSEEHTSELQSRGHLVCRLLLEKKKAMK